MIENKNLKEEIKYESNENEELKEEAEQNKILFGTTFSELMKHQEENKNLKEENERWVNTMGLLESEYMVKKDKEIFELKAEVGRLKEEVEQRDQSAVLVFAEIMKHKDENTKLMKEQYKLLDEQESLSKTFWSKNKKLQEHLDKSREVSERLIAENNTTMPSQSALYRKNKALTEENNDLVELVYDPNESGKTCQELLKNYRDETEVILKVIGDEAIEEIGQVKDVITTLKDKNEGYRKLLECECGVSIEKVVEIKVSERRWRQNHRELQVENRKIKNELETLKKWCVGRSPSLNDDDEEFNMD
tara:strand:+ start:22 stop:936 length:915 start_codon:yes stop_codon:yes gene_type:complete